jgi:hypothetical protein
MEEDCEGSLIKIVEPEDLKTSIQSVSEGGKHRFFPKFCRILLLRFLM